MHFGAIPSGVGSQFLVGFPTRIPVSVAPKVWLRFQETRSASSLVRFRSMELHRDDRSQEPGRKAVQLSLGRYMRAPYKLNPK